MPENLKDKRLALFFTLGVSLRTWHDIGILDREVKLYNRLSQHFKHIYFFTYGGKKELDYKEYLAENITIVPLPLIQKSRCHNVPLLLSFLYSMFVPVIHYRILKNVDILKTNQMNGAWAAVLSKALFRSTLIVRTGYSWSKFTQKSTTSWLKKNIIRMIEGMAYSFTDGIIVSASADLKYIQQNYKTKGYETVIANYIDTELFKPLGGEKKRNSIFFAGRLNKQKNLFSLLEAAADLPCEITIAGSGDQKDALEKYAKEKDIKVEFLGSIPNNELPRVLNQHEVFVLPSFYEGMPKALLEAMACGLPCIGTNVAGIKEIIIHRENGYLCETTAASIKEAILEIMNNHMLQERIGRNARIMVVEKFALETVLKNEIKIYEEI
jgi:glycosyltransferase involved in cell wall biosynthesis